MSAKLREFYTIGYEGANIDDFSATLKLAGVEILLDIRELPVSRRPGFSKRALKETLGDKGISYVHLKALGDPKEGREAARSGLFERFVQIFESHLEKEGGQLALSAAIDFIDGAAACLMCYERSEKHCHRKIVADRILRIGNYRVRHLGVRPGVAATDGEKPRESADTC